MGVAVGVHSTGDFDRGCGHAGRVRPLVSSKMRTAPAGSGGQDGNGHLGKVLRGHGRPARRRRARHGCPRSTDHRKGISRDESRVKTTVRPGAPKADTHPYRQDAAGSGVLGLRVAGPGSGLSEEPVLGCEPVALESESFPCCPPGPAVACVIAPFDGLGAWSRSRRLRGTGRPDPLRRHRFR